MLPRQKETFARAKRNFCRSKRRLLSGQMEIFRLTDWVAILKEQTATGDQMGREVPQMLANPDISEAQVKTLFSALEKQAEFVEKLRMALEKFGHDFSIIKAAERLEERYADLAASVAEKLKAMRR
jgi:cell division septum initiation protein DivIVA